jgi:hypothetical protein
MSFIKYLGRNTFIPTAPDVEKTVTSLSTGLTDTLLVQQMCQRNEASERQKSLRLVDLLPLLREATSELRSAASNALAAVSSNIDLVNSTRWSWGSTADAFVEQEQRLDSAADGLRDALAEFKATGRLRLLEPFEPHLGTADAPLRGLYVCYVFSASIVVVSEAILRVVETVREITGKRRKNRLWAPKGLRQLVHAFFIEKSTEGDLRAYGETEEVNEIDPEGDAGKFRQYLLRLFVGIHSIQFSPGRDPDSRPPTNFLQRILNGLHLFYHWTKTPEAVVRPTLFVNLIMKDSTIAAQFIFRYVFITVALWVPAVVKTTARK